MFFKGMISLIFDPKIVCNMMMQDARVKVISLDEDNSVPMLCDENNPQVIPGTILLPPIEANWALVDGELDNFMAIYQAHSSTPEFLEYIAAIIAAAYQGNHVIIYFPDEGHEIIKWLYNFFLVGYGISLGINVQQQFTYQQNSIPAYCNAMMSIKAINPYEYLYWYPNDAIIPDAAAMDIIRLLKIPGENINDKIDMVYKLRSALKVDKKTVIPFIDQEV